MDLHEVMELRDSIVSSGMNMHQPINLLKRLKLMNRNESVYKSLMMMLSPEVRSLRV